MNILKDFAIYIAIIIISTMNVFGQSNQRTKWFEEARFGMFIHWGLYSAAEGMWKGENLRYLNNYAEWIRYRNRISKDEYGTLAKRFVWDQINTEEWVIQAKKAGMKYIIMTAKHHDGVAIWDTKIGNYSLPQLAGNKRDIIKELADACRKHDMKLGFYYSHWIDWEHPYAWDHNIELTKNVSPEQFNEYWEQKALPQIEELLTNYGDIALMWFDMWIPYQKTIFKKEQLEKAVKLIRELQPNCLINSRLGLPTDAEFVDFQTMGDNSFGTTYTNHPWETPGTIAHSWGYNAQENEWKSTSQILQSLISNVSLNGGLTLNIGPRANGEIPYESVSRLTEIGNWLNNHGESIYDATGLKLKSKQFDWGFLTTKKLEGLTKIYAQVFNWPLDNILRISGISTNPKQVYYFDGDKKIDLSFQQFGAHLHIQVPEKSLDKYVSNVILVYDTEPKLNDSIVAESTFGGFVCNTNNATNTNELKINKYDGKIPTHTILSEKEIIWDFQVAKQGIYTIDLSAHNPTKNNIDIVLEIDEKSYQYSIKPSGKIVVEPNENNYTIEFVDQRIAEIMINNLETHRLSIKTKHNEPLKFNRLWIDKK